MRLARILGLLGLLMGLAACSDPLPEHQQDYIGLWHSDSTLMQISAEGGLEYEKKDGNFTTSYDLPIAEIRDDAIEASFLFVSATFEMEGPPSRRDGYVTLVVDGEPLRKIDPEDHSQYLVAMPTSEAIEELVRADVERFLRGVEKGDFSDYRAALAPAIRDQLTEERLRAAAATLRSSPIDVDAVLAGHFELAAEPAFDEHRVLQVEGVFLVEDGTLFATNPGFLITPDGLKSIGATMQRGTWSVREEDEAEE